MYSTIDCTNSPKNQSENLDQCDHIKKSILKKAKNHHIISGNA